MLEQDLSSSDIWPVVSSIFKSSVPHTSRELQAWIKDLTHSTRQYWIDQNSSLNIEPTNQSELFLASRITGTNYCQKLSLEDIKRLQDSNLDKTFRVLQIKRHNTYTSKSTNFKTIDSDLLEEITQSHDSNPTELVKLTDNDTLEPTLAHILISNSLNLGKILFPKLSHALKLFLTN